MLQNLPTAWRTQLETGTPAERDTRYYLDFRQREYPDVGAGAPTFTALETLIDRGNCESTTAPAFYTETALAPTNGTWARSSEQAYQGLYAYKLIKTSATGAGECTVWFTSSVATTALNGLVPGQTYTFKCQVYVPSGVGPGLLNIWLYAYYYAGGAWTSMTDQPAAYDAWEELSVTITLPITATAVYVDLKIDSATPVNRYMYVDNIVMTGYVQPGSHYLSGSYSKHLVPLGPNNITSFLVDIVAMPTFAYDVGSDQYLILWYSIANYYCAIVYQSANDRYLAMWKNGVSYQELVQPANTYSATNSTQVWTRFTLYFNPAAGRYGSQLWINGVSVDADWGATPDPMVRIEPMVTFNGMLTTASQFNIAYVRLIPNPSTAPVTANVTNGFKSFTDEEIFWSFNGHATGRTRCPITTGVISEDATKNIRNPSSGHHSANSYGIALRNDDGRFSDDQYAAFDPANAIYNGTVTQQYLRHRCGLIVETWYGSIFDTLFTGRLTAGFPRSSQSTSLSTVSVTAEDGVGDLVRAIEHTGRYWEDKSLVSATVASSLLHLIAARGNRIYKQYLANSSFEATTIGNSWATDGVIALTRSNTYALFGTYSAKLDYDGGAAGTQYIYQDVTFAYDQKLNVGQIFTFALWLLCTAAASSSILIEELDAGGINDSTAETYTVAGGEGWVKVSVTHTITDADSYKVRTTIYVDDDVFLYADGASLTLGNRALNYFEANNSDASDTAVPEQYADDAVEIDWPWFGIVANATSYTHPWRRMDIGTTVWDNLKSLADACGPWYFGFLECDALKLHGVAEDAWSEPVILDTIGENDFAPGLSVSLRAEQANKIIGHGYKYLKSTNVALVWRASDARHFAEGSGDNELAESVANNAYWPSLTDYPEYWARYSGQSAQTGTMQTPIREIQAPTIHTWSHSGASGWSIIPSDPAHDIPSDIPSDIHRDEALAWAAERGWYRPDQLPPWSAYGDLIPQDVLSRLIIPWASSVDGQAIIGLQSSGADLLHRLSDGTSMSEITRGAIVSGLDITSRPDMARILLRNVSGAGVTLIDAGIAGKPVYIQGGSDGAIHDAFVEYDDIAKNGERPFEFGNTDVFHDAVNAWTQLRKLADFYWKLNRGKYHIYGMRMWGTRYYYTPGHRYLLQMGIAGETEYLDSVVECFSVQVSRTPDTLGETTVYFREVEENWKYDSNALTRYIARTWPGLTSQDFQGISIAAGTVIVHSNYRASGTSDEDLINAAITYASGTWDGGFIRLSKGTFYIDGPIVMKSNVYLQGEGVDATTIIKNCNGYGITAVGGVGTELTNISIRDLSITRDAADTNAKELIYLSYVDDSTINNVKCYDGYAGGILWDNSDNVLIENCKIVDCGTSAVADQSIEIEDCNNFTVRRCTSSGCPSAGYLIDLVGAASTIGLIVACQSNGDLYGVKCEGAIGITIAQNRIYDAVINGIHVNNSVDIRIDANHMQRCVNGIYMTVAERFAIAANLIQNSSANGIIVYVDCIDFSLVANTCIANVDGIEINDADQGIVTGNVSTNNTGDGIKLTADTNRVSVTSNNVMVNGGTGILINGATEDLNIVTSNHVYNNTTAQITDNGTGTVVANNVVT